MNPSTLEFFEGPDCPPLAVPENLPAMEVMAASAEMPDARWILTDERGQVRAFLALWWKDTPKNDGGRIGAIGGFAAADGEAAGKILAAACDHLRQMGCRTAVGPMNGNTWRRHRYVIESNGRGPFLLEPRNTGADPSWWTDAGFTVLSRYSSSLVPLNGERTTRNALQQRLERSGVVIRRLNLDRYDEELRAIHQISLKSFSSNFLYTPLEEEAFLTSYQKVKSHANPEFVRIAERDGVPCGFVFGIPDLEALQRGEKPALIVKTLAVDPEVRCAGLGSLLVDEIQESALKLGFTEAIHALQHENNSSLKITGRCHGEVLRRYALFSKAL